ncbi:MAG TPA: preprotein translocase subunit YajC [Magnetospirillum sp.]|nr:preprotein translocase subunit YajC [Magnetospirillum sp.]
MLVSTAFAQAAGSSATGGFDPQILMLPLLLAVFYFLLIRPQQKRAKQHRELISQLRRGDRVLTQGGILGTINKVVDDKEVVVEIAEGVRVRVLRATIQEIVSKTEPVAAEAEKAADK